MYILLQQPALANTTPTIMPPSTFIGLPAAGMAPIKAQWFAEYFRVALRWLWSWFLQLFGDIRSWIVRVLSASHSAFTNLKPAINTLLNTLSSFAFDWPVHALNLAAYIVKNYPHPVHVTAWLIFFGPLAILCPLLLLYEVSIAIAFNTIFIFHGLIPGTLEKYLELREATDDAKQWMFVYIDQVNDTYNKRTMESNSLLVLRLVAGAAGLYILCYIWFL
ncbi:hypothetical protein M378DRAFT_160274 [Amanita muscaria Koide BX008]|uniref:Uncharacterized protein n=1 Tax=Amanita muscaria (strain Koide BX008) TaxID=946122 RepID=A0A0C2WYN0_AMAMK|nr:hypothetical protein M378DRAFT_160274 [Amanita muscaria Koide BX008]